MVNKEFKLSSQTKGFVLIMVSITMMMGLVGGVEQLPPTAGVVEWVGVLMVFVIAGVAGLLGFSFLQEE